MTKRAAIFTTSLMVCFSGALMPGRLLTVIISQSAQRGFWQGPLL
jgi:threonine/homoserine/homoserine lactone efflux protein